MEVAAVALVKEAVAADVICKIDTTEGRVESSTLSAHKNKFIKILRQKLCQFYYFSNMR
jgi:hypothetical protein